MIDINSQDGSQQCRQILTIPIRVIAASAVAQSDVEKSVRPKLNRPTVVIPERLRNPHDLHFSRRITDIRIVFGDRES